MKVDFGTIRERFAKTEEIVNCPAWGGDVTLRRATAGERMDAAILISGIEIDEETQSAPDTQQMIRACIPIASQTIVDNDVRPFDSDEGRVELLENHAMAVVQLIPSILRLNALGANADEAIDDAKKNLPIAPSGT